LSTSTKQFAWKNRKTAAQDLLQLVYHAPLSVSRLSAQLLPAIRSHKAFPQLRDLVLDTNIDGWIRIYALRACASIRSEIVVPEFEQLARVALTDYEQTQSVRNRYINRSPDLHELASFVDNQPKNRQWFFALLDDASPDIQAQFITSSLLHLHSDEFEQILLKRLLELMEAHPDLLDFRLILRGASQHFEVFQSWLDIHFTSILELSLKNPEDTYVINLARQWRKLRVAIQAEFKNWHVFPPLPRSKRNQSINFKSSPAYIFLFDLYQQAKASDHTAYQQLLSIARRWRGNIPIRAVATHWIGKLKDVYNVFPVLCYQLRYADVDWEIDLFDAPIRYEAGEALLQFKNSETWETLVDSCFIRPSNDLLPFQTDWIAYLTDVLSGEIDDYDGVGYGSVERRAWFQQLVNVDKENLE